MIEWIASGSADIVEAVVFLEQGMVLALCNRPFILPTPAEDSWSVWGDGCDMVFLNRGFQTVLD
jgi:hypothetical protein